MTDQAGPETVGRRLHDLETLIRGRLAEASETGSVGELSAYDNHPADLATDTVSRETDAGLRRGLERELWEVRRAEEKMADGSYGLCDRCDGAIGAGRLRARPQATLCAPCAKAVEPPYVPPPSEEAVVKMPYGDRPDRASPEPDGEDIWQEVAQWGTSDGPQDIPPAIDYHETFVGFDEPIGIVEEVEAEVDEHHDPILEAARGRPRRQGRRIPKQTDKY